MTTVNGEPLDPALLEETFLRIKSTEEALSEASCCERDDEFMRMAEEELVEGVLLAQEAERSIPAPEADEVRTEMEATIREWRDHGASWDLLDARRDSLRAEIVSRLRMDRFMESVWKDLPELTNDDHRTWYEANKEEFRTTARAHVMHLMRIPGNRPAEDFRAMRDLRERVLDGEDFISLAAEHTQKENGETDLGWIEHERPLNPFEAMVFSLREHEVGPVFFYERTLHLVWVEELEPEHIPEFEEVAETVAARTLNEQRRKALADIASNLREKAEILRTQEA